MRCGLLARPTPTVDVLTHEAAVESVRADLDTILKAQVPKFEAPSAEPTEDIVMAALFATTDVPPPPP